jgi:glycosyltransferase involved in cell wall biosynthesis
LHKPNFNPRGGYVAFLGRISPEKRPERAILIARALGIPLKIAPKVDKVDEAYFREQIAPLLNDPGIEFIGEIDEYGKAEFLGGLQPSTLDDFGCCLSAGWLPPPRPISIIYNPADRLTA